MRDTPRHTYQLLTKRAERLFEVAPDLDWSDNGEWVSGTEASVATPGLHFIEYYSVDVFGNIEEAKRADFSVSG